MSEYDDCPYCDNSGIIIVEGVEAGCCGCPHPNGECCGDPIPVQTQEQAQCEFCYTNENSVFNNANINKPVDTDNANK